MREPFLYRLVRPLIVFAVWLFSPRFIHQEVLPEKGPFVIACNHLHAFDPLFLIRSTKATIHFLAKQELTTGLFGGLIKGMGVIPVDRSKKDNSAVLEASVAYLKNGRVIGVFPEGTRNRTDAPLLPLKTGAVRMARKAGVPLIPVVRTGKIRLFSKDLTIRFGDPVDIRGLSTNDANALLTEKMLALLEKNE